MIITVNGKQRDYVGIKDAEPNRTHTFNLYNKHYFLEETTPFSTYYINHLSTLTEADFDKYDKEFQNNRWKPARTFIKSSNLVKELMKQGYFEPITYGQFCILNTIYYKDIDDVNIINLEYNEDYCTQLIAPHKRIYQELIIHIGMQISNVMYQEIFTNHLCVLFIVKMEQLNKNFEVKIATNNY